MASVDTEVHPAATGAAAQLVAQHVDEQALKLWGAWFCPFVQCSWIVLEEKKIPYQWLEVNPYRKAPGFLKLNPRGLVPVLAMKDAEKGEDEEERSLLGSSVICEYLEDAYADEAKHGPRLLPADPYQRARAHLWIDHVMTRIVPAFYKFLQHQPYKDYTLESVREELLGHIKTFTAAMDAKGPWFLGKQLSLVDISLVPWVVRFFLLDYYKEGGMQVPAAEADEVWARWHRWTKTVLERQSVKETTSDAERYVKAYERYANDTTKSQVGQATRQGVRLP